MSPEKRVAIVQSNYVPWRGYFDLIDSVDEFVLLDDVQYTRRDWRNRNRIKTEQGTRWLTIPVQVSGRYTQTIAETRGRRAGLGRPALVDRAPELPRRARASRPPRRSSRSSTRPCPGRRCRT